MVQSPSYRQKKAHNEYHFVPSCRKTKSSPLTWPKNGPSLPPGLQQGAVPSQYQSLARYVAKYVVSPPISVRRIDRYDGHQVTYHYRSHRTERVEHETVDVDTFIGRMVQHTVPKGFKRIRYYGVQATKRMFQRCWSAILLGCMRRRATPKPPE